MAKRALISQHQIESAVFTLRGEKVLLDADLAFMYGVTTKALNQAVKRNLGRFPSDFMFRLTQEELDNLRSQIVTSSLDADSNRSQSVTGPGGALRSQFVTLKGTGHGGRRHLPLAFTEQGVAMLSSVLHSDHAVRVNVEIMRAFVRLRKVLAVNTELAAKLNDLERRVGKHDEQFIQVIRAIRQLMDPPPTPPKRKIGFHVPSHDAPTANLRRASRK